MADPTTQLRTQRPRNLSPADIGLLAERAGRRNASRELNLPNLNALGDSKIHSSQNAFSTAGGSSPLASTHYPQQSYQNGTVSYTSTPSNSRDLQLQIHKSRAAEKSLGYDLSVSSNMPSQVSRQTPQESAVAARVHAERVKAMQLNLAADPNILAPQASNTVPQLVAQGPPLTGRYTISTTTLPSVLTPYSRTPLMTYAQALQAIVAETGPLHILLRLELLEPAPVTVLLYDDKSRSLGVSESLVLTKEIDLKTLVLTLQGLLDAETSSMPGSDGSRFLITHIEVRNGSDEMRHGHPALKGECRGGDKVTTAACIRWIINGDMEHYWRVYRIVLQTQAPQSGDKKPAVKPIFRVKTVRQVVNIKGSSREGHDFVDVSIIDPSPGSVQELIEEAGNKNNDSLNFVSQQQAQDGFKSRSSKPSRSESRRASKSTPSTNKTSIKEIIAISAPDSVNDDDNTSDVPGDDSASIPGSSKANHKTKAVDPTRNWGYYQRMGGDPENHKKYDLSHLPFEVEDFPVRDIVFDPVEEQKILDRIRTEGWNYDTTATTSIPKIAAFPPTHPPIFISAEEKARLEKYAREFEISISFEDDDNFFGNLDTQIPDAHKIVAARAMGNEKQNIKRKKKESPIETPNSFYTAFGSQNNYIMEGFQSLNIGTATRSSGNNISSDYSTPEGHRRTSSFDAIGSNFMAVPGDSESHDHYSEHNSSKQSADRIVSRFTGTFDSKTSQKDHDQKLQHELIDKLRYEAPLRVKEMSLSDLQNFGDSFSRPKPMPHDLVALMTKDPTKRSQLHKQQMKLREQQMKLQGQQMKLVKVSSMNVHAPEYISSNAAMSPYLQSLAGAPAPEYTRFTPSAQTNHTYIPSAAAMDAIDGFTTFSQPNIQRQQSNTALQSSPGKQYRVSVSQGQVSAFDVDQNSGFFNSSSVASSPEKTLVTRSGRTSRHQSPDREGMTYEQRHRSPGRINNSEYGSIPLFRNPSSDKVENQQGQGQGSQFAHDSGHRERFHCPQFNKSGAQQDLGSGFQYNQNEHYDFDFNFHSPAGANDNGQGRI